MTVSPLEIARVALYASINKHWKLNVDLWSKRWYREHTGVDIRGDAAALAAFALTHPNHVADCWTYVVSNVRNHCVNAKRIVELNRNNPDLLNSILVAPVHLYEPMLDHTLACYAAVDALEVPVAIENMLDD
jgi:hypothetical protein